ncbi:WD-40 repeat protein [Crocosphaera subtropica ATCC 51142]|uniref:WD-40 repeat protein n=2 Tax=Crocosphaera TaxID=263510 RepID=B1WPG6_CROS5|nr:WD-40 repeat protein [Crocosphaera subtropica ATCC 51142]
MKMSAIATTAQRLEIGTAKLWIVLVGVNQYEDRNLRNLKYCANDCQELAEVLEIATRQFQETEIIALYDGGEKIPNLSEIHTSIEAFQSAKPEDTVLFYFSGHGYLDTNNQPILCVADTQLEDLAGTGLKLDRLLNLLRQCEAERQLIWIDACQERDQEDNSIRGNTTGQIIAILEQQAQPKKNFYGMLSCDINEQSWEFDELKHGLFTYYIIEGLRGKAANAEGRIDADSLFRYVQYQSNKFIQYKKNIINTNNFFKGMLGSLRESSNPVKVNRFPANASQTPRQVSRGGSSSELVIGLGTSCHQRKALIIDQLSFSETNIQLCRILQDKGSFEVDYCFLKDKRQRNIQEIISDYLQEETNQTLLLYLTGTIEITSSAGYELVCQQNTRINLKLLSQQLQTSPIKEIMVIADLFDVDQNNQSLSEVLQLNHEELNKSLCVITATSSLPNNRQFLKQLITILENAGDSERAFWVSDLITQLQKWCQSQSGIKLLKPWLSDISGVMELLVEAVQRSNNKIFELDICPYKSLEAFTQEDAYFFHGREELINEIINKLKSTSFLAVVGASGSGKSSVVRAGVIPQLLSKGLYCPDLEAYQSCQTWVMFPGESPIINLAKILAPDNPDFLEGVLQLGSDSLAEWLHQQPQEMSLLVIDQFEELFTPKEELFTPKAEAEQVDFIHLILGAIEKCQNSFKVIITLRSDFLNECLAMEELAPLISKSEILVPSCRLEDQQYCQMIAKPAQKVGLEVEDELLKLLLGELQEGSLPLLQYALAELWQEPKRTPGKLTVKDYQEYIGKLGNFLSQKAEETYRNSNESQQKCTELIFLRLVFLAEEQGDSNKATRRRLPLSDLRVDESKDVLEKTLQALIKARLIVVSGKASNLVMNEKERVTLIENNEEKINEQNEEQITVEVAHEILLRDWKTLKWWLEKNREKYRLIREIERKADEWEKTGKQNDDKFLLSKRDLDKYEEFCKKYAKEISPISNEFIDINIKARDKREQLAKRRQRQIIGGLTGGIVGISMVAVVALWQLRRATINEINALSNNAEALLASNQELDALVTGLKAGRRIKNSFFGVDNKIKIKLIGKLQNIFYQIREFNRLEGHEYDELGITFSPNGEIIASYDIKTIRIWNFKGKLLTTIKAGHTSWIDQVVFSPNGQIVASASSLASATTGQDGTIKLWNLKGKLLHTLNGHGRWVNQVVFSPDGQTIASGGWDGTVKLWNLKGDLLHTFEGQFDGAASSVAFSPDGQTIVSGGSDGTVKLWNLRGDLLNTLNGHEFEINRILFSPSGELIASSSYDKTIKLWNLKGDLIHTFEGHKDVVENIMFSPNSQFIVSSDSEDIKLWKLGGKLVHTIKGKKLFQTSGGHKVLFNSNGKIIASSGIDGTVKLWNLMGELIYTLPGNNVTFHPNGLIVASSDAKDIRFWNFSEELLHTSKKLTDDIGEVAFSSDSSLITSFGRFDEVIKLWNLHGDLLETFRGHQDGVLAVAFSHDSQYIVSSSDDRTIKLWNLHGDLLETFRGHQDSVFAVAFSPDGQYIISGSNDRTIKLWNLHGDLLETFRGHQDGIFAVAFSPDGQYIISGSNDRTIKLWNLQGDLLKTFEGHVFYISSLRFNPDGQTIASASADKTIKLWNLQGDLLETFDDDVNSIVFSPDGQTIASASADKTIKLWNLQGDLLEIFQGHQDSIFAVAFSPDGQTIASISADNTIKLWSLDLDEVMTRGCDWVRDYLTNNPNVSEEDRKICDGIGNE